MATSAEDAVTAFASLRGRGERLQALRSLIAMLNLEERNAVQAAISEENDIVTRLPLELCLQVFDHLDVLAVWRLQSVSKAWRARLTSQDLLRNAVVRWDDGDASEAAPSATPLHERALSSSIRHIRALREARPFSWRAICFQDRIRFWRLGGQYLVYVELSDPGVLVVQDLCTGTVEFYRDEAREEIKRIIVTSRLLAFTTQGGGVAYWKRLADPQTPLQHVQLPSANFLSVAEDGDCIVFLVRAENTRFTSILGEILLFDASVPQLRPITVPKVAAGQHIQSPGSTWTLIVSAEKRYIDLFYSDTLVPGQAGTEIRHIRVSFEGEVLRSSSAFCTHERSDYRRMLLSRGRIGDGGRHALLVRQSSGSAEGHLVFDVRLGTFVHDARAQDVMSRKPTQGWVSWKGMVYCLADRESTGSGEENIRYFSGPLEVDAHDFCGRYQSVNLSSVKTMVVPSEDFHMKMNDTFLLARRGLDRQRDVIEVFCFDEEVQLHDGQSTGLWDGDEEGCLEHDVVLTTFVQ